MRSELRKLHPYLYRRVLTKGVLFTALGISATFAEQVDAFFRTQRSTPLGWEITLTGIVFLVFGLAVLYTLHSRRFKYTTPRVFVYMGFIFCVFWAFILMFSLIAHKLPTLSILILWIYLTFNLHTVAHDSAWDGAALVKQTRERDRGNI